MKKNEFNGKFREHARTLSPHKDEQILITKLYNSYQDVLGASKCLQVGSFPRFTAITPVHDLDILFFLGDWSKEEHNPIAALEDLRSKIETEYKNPTDFKLDISLQTHSVTIAYLRNDEEFFSIDIVPAYVFRKNEFNEDTYKVPEIIRKTSGKQRLSYYQKLSQQNEEMRWIISDPRGYIKVASDMDKNTNGEFRKATKLIKKWKNNLSTANRSLKLKSFHLEQVVTQFFLGDSSLEIFDIIFEFFVELPKIIDTPNQICDRANSDKYIDDYIEDFTNEQKNTIKVARDNFLIKLEKFREHDSVAQLLEVNFKPRTQSEKFLFDFDFKTLTDDNLKLVIDGFVMSTPGFSSGSIRKTPHLQKGITCGGRKTRKIQFSIQSDRTGAQEHWWKVKNSNTSEQPRGDITRGGTKNNPESTLFPSRSYIECYAVTNGVCVAKDRVDLNIV